MDWLLNEWTLSEWFWDSEEPPPLCPLLSQFRVVTAPFHHVGFADFWLADQLNSLVVVLMDLEYMICFYSFELDWKKHDGLISSSGGTEMLNATSHNPNSDSHPVMTTLCACHSLQVKTCVIPTPMASVRWSSVFLLGSDSSSACGVTVTPNGPSLTWLTQGNTPLPSLSSPSLPYTAHIKVHTPLLEYPLQSVPAVCMYCIRDRPFISNSII